jgi:hypothetical protein
LNIVLLDGLQAVELQMDSTRGLIDEYLVLGYDNLNWDMPRADLVKATDPP